MKFQFLCKVSIRYTAVNNILFNKLNNVIWIAAGIYTVDLKFIYSVDIYFHDGY